mmetsp:Transcript_7928/g.9003  ORF Transcript_7928/g.9003 Transcript_7928/m.9003 type:complete len:117 (+) Transcript_7928:451-801(+)
MLDDNYPIPMLYIYGTNDKIITSYENAVSKVGEFKTIVHDKGHTIPRLTGENMDTFTSFFANAYEKKFGVPFDRSAFVIDDNFKQQYIEVREKRLISKVEEQEVEPEVSLKLAARI